jgi:hypothetical protein
MCIESILYELIPVCDLNWVFYKKLSTHTKTVSYRVPDTQDQQYTDLEPTFSILRWHFSSATN